MLCILFMYDFFEKWRVFSDQNVLQRFLFLNVQKQQCWWHKQFCVAVTSTQLKARVCYNTRCFVFLRQ